MALPLLATGALQSIGASGASASGAASAGASGGTSSFAATQVITQQMGGFGQNLKAISQPFTTFTRNIKDISAAFRSGSFVQVFSTIGKKFSEIIPVVGGMVGTFIDASTAVFEFGNALADAGAAALAGGKETMDRTRNLATSSFSGLFAPISAVAGAAFIVLGQVLLQQVIPASQDFAKFLIDHKNAILLAIDAVAYFAKVLIYWGEKIGSVERIARGAASGGVTGGIGALLGEFNKEDKKPPEKPKERSPQEMAAAAAIKPIKLDVGKEFDKAMQMMLRQLQREYQKATAGFTGFGGVEDRWEQLQEGNLRMDEIMLQQLDIQRQMLQALIRGFTPPEKQISGITSVIPLMAAR